MVDEVGAVRGQVRTTGYRRVTHGLYLPEVSTDARTRLRAELAALTLVLPEGAGFTHVTSAWLRGWWLPRLPDHTPVFAATPGAERPRRPGLVCSRLATTVIDDVRGLPCVSAEETLLRAARDLSLLDLTPMVESALRNGEVTVPSVTAVAAGRRPGVRRLRAALDCADPRSESPMETCLRLFHQAVGIAVVPQYEVVDGHGRLVARADLLVAGTTFLHEYDGDVHASRQARVTDLRRDRAIQAAGFVRRGFVAQDLFAHPVTLLYELDQALGRVHRPRRLTGWRSLVAGSTYTYEGRERLQRRWWTGGDTLQWAQTA